MNRCFALLLVACTGTPEVGARAFVAGGDAYVGVVGDADSVQVYVCDGEPDGSSVRASHWFAGDVMDEAFELEGPGGRAEGTFDGEDGVSGTVTLLDGTEVAFDGAPAPLDATDRGLFRAEGTSDPEGPFVAGWILLGQDDQRGGIAFADSNLLFNIRALPPDLEGLSIEVEGHAIDVEVKNAVSAFLP